MFQKNIFNRCYKHQYHWKYFTLLWWFFFHRFQFLKKLLKFDEIYKKFYIQSFFLEKKACIAGYIRCLFVDTCCCSKTRSLWSNIWCSQWPLQSQKCLDSRIPAWSFLIWPRRKWFDHSLLCGSYAALLCAFTFPLTFCPVR